MMTKRDTELYLEIFKREEHLPNETEVAQLENEIRKRGLVIEGTKIALGLDDLIKKVAQKAQAVSATAKAASAVSSVAGLDFDEGKHPRDEHGRFAKKESGKRDAGTDIESLMKNLAGELGADEIEVISYGDDGDGTSMKIKLDGIEYHAVGDVSPETIREMHKVNKQIGERLAEMGYDDVPDRAVSIVAYSDDGDYSHLEKYIKANDGFSLTLDDKEAPVRDLAKAYADFAREKNGFIPTIIRDGPIVMDDRLISAGRSDIAESLLVHERLHSRERAHHAYDEGIYEEAYNTVLSLEYYDKYNLPPVIGYAGEVGTIAYNFRKAGYTKDEMYQAAREFHKVDGSSYSFFHIEIAAKAGVYGESFKRNVNAYTQLVHWYNREWIKTWNNIGAAYGWSGEDVEEIIGGWEW